MSRNGKMYGRKAKSPLKTLKRLMSYIGKYKIRLMIVLICIAIGSLVTVAGARFLQVLIDDYIQPLLLSDAPPVYTELLKAISVMGIIYLAGIFATFLQNILMVKISQGVLKEVRDEMFSHMQKLPIKYFDTHTHGDLMSRYTNDTDALRQMISQSVPQLFSSAITIITVFISMLMTDILLTLIVLITICFMLFAAGKVSSKSSVYFVKNQKSLGSVNGYIEEMVNGQKVIKVFCHEEKVKDNFDKLNEELYINASKAHKYANILMPIMANLGHLQYVIIAIAGGALAIGGIGGLTLGSIAAFLQLSRNFNMPINQVAQQLNSIIMALAGAERIFEVIDEKQEDNDGCVTLVNAKVKSDGSLEPAAERTGIWAWKEPHSDGSISLTKVNGEVRFFDVDFGYSEEQTVLHDISLYANPGEKVAFVGATGAGKTTVTNLINRFYDIKKGKICYDGIDIKKISKADLRRSLGIVLQDTTLFTGTVMDNIRYGNLDATDEEVYEAARLANADMFINMLPKGYDTVISDNGSGISQGQRQLLSIARAAVADPPVMILDEATSSIDTRTERIVQSGMDSLMKGRTVFVIAHRLSTVQNSDVIVYLDNGKIAEKGTHEGLIEQKGKYYSLYTGAFELE